MDEIEKPCHLKFSTRESRIALSLSDEIKIYFSVNRLGDFVF